MAQDTVGFPPDGCDARVRWLFEYWQRKHPAADQLPGRQHVDPLDFPQLLRWVWLVDVQRFPLRFKYRLIGSEHVTLFGKDYTGHWVDAVLPGIAGTPLEAGLHGVALNATPYYEHSPSYFRYRAKERTIARPTRPERLMLPLARDGRTVDMILAITIAHPAEAGSTPPAY